jgi:hypothetical protein
VTALDKDTLTAARLRELLAYDFMSGVLTWRARPVRPGTERTANSWNAKYAGCVAGCVHGSGYLQIKIDYRSYRAHRLAWVFQTGTWPKDQIDHINLDKADNRFCNLREATPPQQGANRCTQSNNKSGWKGVAWDKRKRKWQVAIRNGGKHPVHLGYFDKPQHAAAVYHAAALWFKGPFTRVDDSYRLAIEPGKLVILDAIRDKFATLHDQVADLLAQRDQLARDVAPYLETRAAFERRVFTNLADLTGFWGNAA